MIFLPPLISQTLPYLGMGSIFEHISVVFTKKRRLLLFGAVALLASATPISVSLHPKLQCRLPSWPSFLLKNVSWASWLSSSWFHCRIRPLLERVARLVKRSRYDRYRTPEDEARYWEQAERGRKVLERSDARFVGADRVQKPLPELPPLVIYYTPALPPLYRDTRSQEERRRKKKEKRRYYISSKTYCKWHRMVFPNSVSRKCVSGPLWALIALQEHPTISQASKYRAEKTSDELREIHRISQMLPDDAVFAHPGNPEPKISSKYHRIWQEWKAARR
ncbi:unnamed protein product [Cyclocybe aegerita]|uniref:Uncharacterized protein n=1 Tax=Cyclocybe aegerita TaxID=1973307 RepID=A0A8S0X6D4_CYCAE|nr:unnamed protein product [Cyclocybe aegerita]